MAFIKHHKNIYKIKKTFPPNLIAVGHPTTMHSFTAEDKPPLTISGLGLWFPRESNADWKRH